MVHIMADATTLYGCATVVFRNRSEFLSLCGHGTVADALPLYISVQFIRSGQSVNPTDLSSLSRPYAFFTDLNCESHEQNDADSVLDPQGSYAVNLWYRASNVRFRNWVLGVSPSQLSVTRNANHGGGSIVLHRTDVPDLNGVWADPHHSECDGTVSLRSIESKFGSLSFSGNATYSADEQLGGVDTTKSPQWTFSGTFPSAQSRAPVTFQKITHGSASGFSVAYWLLEDAKYLLWYLENSDVLQNVWIWKGPSVRNSGHNDNRQSHVRDASGDRNGRACVGSGPCRGKYQDNIAVDHCLGHGPYSSHCNVQARLVHTKHRRKFQGFVGVDGGIRGIRH